MGKKADKRRAAYWAAEEARRREEAARYKADYRGWMAIFIVVALIIIFATN